MTFGGPKMLLHTLKPEKQSKNEEIFKAAAGETNAIDSIANEELDVS